jgi:hypothetical protein
MYAALPSEHLLVNLKPPHECTELPRCFDRAPANE